MCLGSRRTNGGSDGDANRQVDKTQEQAGICPKQDAIYYKKGWARVHLNCSPPLTNLTIYFGTKEIAVILAQNNNNTGFSVFGTSVIISIVCSKVCAEHLPE